MRKPNPNIARRRRLAAFGVVSLLVAAVAALCSVFSIGLLPPSIAKRQLDPGAAAATALLRTAPTEARVAPDTFETRARRTNLVASVMVSPPIIDRIAARIGVAPSEIEVDASPNENVPAAFVEPDNERRANQILESHAPYRLDLQPRAEVPVLDIYAQAPSVADATRLADASVAAADEYLRELARQHGKTGTPPVSFIQLGAARGGSLDSTAPEKIFALTFLTVGAIAFGLLCLADAVRRGWLRAGGARRRRREPEPGAPGTGALAAAADGSADTAAAAEGADNWPHTTRIMPWTVAAFIALVWLVPINAITAGTSMPIDLKLDRLILPVIVLIWLLSFATGGTDAPRWRFGKVHAAVFGFVAVAFLSVVLNAGYLDHTLELGLAIKKLSMLAGFFLLFLIVASVVRPREVRPFINLMLGLAVLCAVGVLWQFHFGVNLFYEWSATVLPGFFHVTIPSTGVYDEIGRPAVTGPADLGLETVAMLAIGLPIALVRLMHAERPGQRFLYALAACLLLAAMVATYRKSALLAPLTICLILAYFRRRELLRLAPIGLVIAVALPILAPNAVGSIIEQFQPSRLSVATVDDRVSDYDAVRPDLLSNPTLGRGYGTYEHTSYRILDNDLLMRVVETGVIGLVAFILMLILPIAYAAPVIRGRSRERAPPALAIAAALGAFLVLSELFDIMSFPQAPYLLMMMLGLLAVILGGRDEPTARLRLRLGGRVQPVEGPAPVEAARPPEREKALAGG
jgi:O-antigen ligase